MEVAIDSKMNGSPPVGALSKPGEYLSILVILVSVVAQILETWPGLGDVLRARLSILEWVVLLFFSAEYLTRCQKSRPRRSYVFSFWGVVDLLAILPSLLGLAADLQSLRLVRILRLFRILKLARYSSALRRFGRAIYLAREDLILFFLVASIAIYLSALGIYHFEHEEQPESFGSMASCLWWAVATLTTVGYGDMYPISDGGRFFTFVVLMLGLGLVAIPAGMIASALTEARREDTRGTVPAVNHCIDGSTK